MKEKTFSLLKIGDLVRGTTGMTDDDREITGVVEKITAPNTDEEKFFLVGVEIAVRLSDGSSERLILDDETEIL